MYKKRWKLQKKYLDQLSAARSTQKLVEIHNNIHLKEPLHSSKLHTKLQINDWDLT